MNLYSYDEIAGKFGISNNTVSKIRKKNNISLIKKEKKFFIKKCNLCLFKNKKKSQGHYYKVSVFDISSSRFIVKKCCLKKTESYELVAEFSKKGIVARASPHVDKKRKWSK